MKYSSITFLCGARDYHAMDWYRRAKERLNQYKIIILTDLICSEGYKKLITKDDNVQNLLIIDDILLRKQSKIGNIWRNIIKILVLPIQVYKVKQYSKNNKNTIFYAHSMYYLLLGMLANINYVGRPQGSDILIKPYKSRLVKFFTSKALLAAKSIIVDSDQMKESINDICGNSNRVYVIRNGIDLESINKTIKNNEEERKDRIKIVSIRGITSLYRIENLLHSRSKSLKNNKIPIEFIYPYYELSYKKSISKYLIKTDIDHGRLDKFSMYNILNKTKLVISIPISDSSPRSVFEAIFCGCIVAITYNKYYETLPDSIKKRIILVDINDPLWFDSVMNNAKSLSRFPLNIEPCQKQEFDQNYTFKTMSEILLK